ncbi:hypothetical protein JB92DRAFT_3218927 [Gautieria morchelliformis]|nr:hypothetical protein JB92DRAFT_3218927 [Gautieria morchelliformis]
MNSKGLSNIWRTVEPQSSSLSSHRMAAKVYTDKLDLSGAQRCKIEEIYKTNKIEDYTFLSTNETQQIEPTACMATLQLDFDAWESLASHWSNKWARNSGKSHNRSHRVLFQCDCGYDHQAAGYKKHLNAVNFTGCLAHVEVTYLLSTQNILRICGYLIHNEECKEAVIACFPSVPLHPSVYGVALKQLRDGATLTDIQECNWQMLDAHLYCEQPHDLGKSLYRQFNRQQGIKVSEQAHINVHEWLDPNSPQFDKALRDAIFHYREDNHNGYVIQHI